MPLRREDLVVRADDPDIAETVREWSWLVEGRVRPLLLTMFGDWFIEREDHSIVRLDAVHGELERVADDIAGLERLLDRVENQIELLRAPLVEELHEANLVPGPRECYAFRHPPILGGAIALENVKLLSIRVWQAIMAQLHEQMRR